MGNCQNGVEVHTKEILTGEGRFYFKTSLTEPDNPKDEVFLDKAKDHETIKSKLNRQQSLSLKQRENKEYKNGMVDVRLF